MASFNLDLHGYKRTEALEEFISFYNHVFDNAPNPAAVSLDVVHGYGSTGEGGVLLKRLRTFLETQGNCLEFTLGERADGNPGHTIVTMLCDYGHRYFSKLYNPAFLRAKDLPVPPWLD